MTNGYIQKANSIIIGGGSGSIAGHTRNNKSMSISGNHPNIDINHHQTSMISSQRKKQSIGHSRNNS
jgi:hypothetical protein